ncbi:deoxyadenosine/deoxycytidine kinase [Entomoplasma freundtii]|uniref:Deoxyadenosine/deoxycytidine kinase n=1 Tax=Entomoplasma freundtii TaxID=74700 RepID=A0A2K8NRY0_9MOLU|nr:deoxynucleoside kinase [Entomoplasma freundtii]ATZ16537.1 deoxyadenosine/deoxycytidine kinase [Entomoplasma freundtii]TDY58297.1 deoxyadenosine/deoxycytidine kinase [Entomoplasma freundtii]
MRIAIFGTVGVGKSSVSKRISEELGYEIFPEPIDDNPYFEEYYKDMKNTVFKMQVYMLTARSLQLTQAKQLKNVIFDRTILEDPIFVKVNHELGNMNDVDFKTYNSFYDHVVMPSLGERANFDLVIYLKASTDKAIERIKERGRIEELDMQRAYWDVLNKHYEEYYQKNKDKFNFLVVDAETDDMDAKMKIILEKIKSLETQKQTTTKKNKNKA